MGTIEGEVNGREIESERRGERGRGMGGRWRRGGGGGEGVGGDGEEERGWERGECDTRQIIPVCICSPVSPHGYTGTGTFLVSTEKCSSS